MIHFYSTHGVDGANRIVFWNHLGDNWWIDFTPKEDPNSCYWEESSYEHWFKHCFSYAEKLGAPEWVLKPYKAERLFELTQKFITDQRIHCGETVYQSDRVIENGYEFIHEACKIVGFFKDPDDEEDA